MSTTATAQPTVLITGANRGIGLGLAESFQKKGYKVIIAIRDPSKAPKIEGSIVVKIDSSSRTDAKEAVEELKNKYGINQLDIVIANAGISEHYALVKDIDIDELNRHHLINTQGPLVLFQAVYPLLKKEGGSKFVVVSTQIASNTLERFPTVGAYSASKSAINYLARQIHFEEPHITTFFYSPGMVDTDMGAMGAAAFGMDKPMHLLSDTLPQMVKLIEEAKRETHSGNFYNYDGTTFPF